MVGLWQNPAILWISGDETVKDVIVTAAEILRRCQDKASGSFSFRGIAKRADSADPLKVAGEIEVGWTRDLSWFISGMTVSLYGVHCYLSSRPLTWMPK
jgi:hypothetical protein